MGDYDDEFLCRFGLSNIYGIGPRKFKQILENYDSVITFLQTNKEFSSKYNVPTIDKLIKNAQIDIPRVEEYGVNITILGEKEYPSYLEEISDPPVVLYWIGKGELLSSRKLISIVGTRNMTDYGKHMIQEFVSSMVSNKYVTVSGMAFGVDKEVHQRTIVEEGDSVAVLASPPNIPTPTNNTDIYNKLVKSGLVISERLPWDSEMKVGAFPRRNRIIAGISPALLIVEAADSSGSLITANQAFGEGRLVFAIPGRIGQKFSVGTNRLIKDNKAKLVESFDDILIELGINKQVGEVNEKYVDLTENERTLVEIVSSGTSSFEGIRDLVKYNDNEIRQTLGILEIKGLLTKSIDGNYSLT